MSEKDGGPAFPTHGLVFDNGEPMQRTDYGMTIRDYFAAQAVQAVYADYVYEAHQKYGFDEEWKMGVAMDAYAMADAMLKARAILKP